MAIATPGGAGLVHLRLMLYAVSAIFVLVLVLSDLSILPSSAAVLLRSRNHPSDPTSKPFIV